MKVSPRRAELLQRFTESIRENSEWFMQAYKKTLETNEKLAYDSRLGLSEEEWKEFGKMNEENIGIEMVSSGYERVTVKKKKGVISFKTGEKLDALNELTIDTKRNKVTMFGYELAPQDTICVVDPTNVFKSTWRGYKWQYVEPEDATMPTSQEELANFSSLMLTFMIGLVDATGETVIEISASQIENGQKTVHYKIPFFFDSRAIKNDTRRD